MDNTCWVSDELSMIDLSIQELVERSLVYADKDIKLIFH